MIENTNVSKVASNGEFLDIKKYIGVASIKVLHINPNKDIFSKYGWNLPEDAEEPKYQFSKERDGKLVNYFRVRFLAQIQDLDDKPVIPIDFLCRPDMQINADGTKAKIIDWYGRTAWGTKAEIQAKKIPQYTSGPANISQNYHICHYGEEELITFFYKLLNITPLSIFDRVKNNWVPTKNPGRLSFDNWNLLASGNNREIAEWVATQPDNCVKVVLGVQTTPDNKTYQAFLNTGYIGNGASVNPNTGEYDSARKLIDKYVASHPESNYLFDAKPVREYTVSASEVKENEISFDDTQSLDPQPDDLPWA
jgi:hypothetical protein